MWWMLLAIIGCYAFAALMVRFAARRCPGRRSRTHVVLLADNQGGRIEWYLRRLRRWSLRTGKDVRVTLVDCGSTDDTAAIAERFGRRAGAVTVVRSDAIAEAGGLTGSPAAMKESRRRCLLTPALAAGIGGGFGGDMGTEDDGGRGGSDGVGGGPGRFGEDVGGCRAEELLLIDLGDPVDVALLP